MSGPIHDHFGLSYSSWLVIPRRALQSMPEEWQARLVALIEEIPPFDEPMNGYSVTAYSPEEQDLVDDLGDYGRGRRKMWLGGP